MLRRGPCVVLLTLLLVFLFPLFASAAPVVFTVGSTTFSYAGSSVPMDVAPYVKDGRVYLPLRYVAQATGVTFENVSWDDSTRSVFIKKDGRMVQLWVGHKAMITSDGIFQMDVAPEIRSGRVMLPVRWIATAFGLDIKWDDATRTVTIELPQAVAQPPEDLRQQLTPADVIERARPAVVLIETNRGQGTGFFWSTDGQVVTNAHVVAGASTITVTTSAGTRHNARIEKADAYLDIAVLKIEGNSFLIIPQYNTQFKQGEEVVALGNPLGLKGSASKGIISAIRDISEIDPQKCGVRIIQTDAAALPGSSGGPLLNMRGEVIGIVFAGAGLGLDVNFAVPIEYYFRVVAKSPYGLKDDISLYLEQDKRWVKSHNNWIKLSEQASSLAKQGNITGALEVQRQLLSILEELQQDVVSYYPQTQEVNDARLLYLEALRKYYQGNTKVLEGLQFLGNIWTASRARAVFEVGSEYIGEANRLLERYNNAKNRLLDILLSQVVNPSYASRLRPVAP